MWSQEQNEKNIILFFSPTIFIPITDTIVFNKNRLRKPDIAHTRTVYLFNLVFLSGLTVLCFYNYFHYLTFILLLSHCLGCDVDWK